MNLPLAIFGIDSSGLNLALNLVILCLVVIWLALVYWTYADARRRVEDPMLVACATAASLFPYVGTFVYLIVRPPEYLDDVREREWRCRRPRRAWPSRAPPLPALRRRGREGLPALPELHAQAQGPMHGLRQAARSDVEDLPVLRGRGPGPVDRLARRRRRGTQREPPLRARPSRPRRISGRGPSARHST